MAPSDLGLLTWMRTLAGGDVAQAARLLAASPDLASARILTGATRDNPKEHFFAAILHYAYAGDTALHLAAAAHHEPTVKKLLALKADVHAKNRRGAEPLHYAADGGPGHPAWKPKAQAAVIARLIAAGAEVDAIDKGGVTPLHRAVRNRCAAAVRALIAGGADVRRKNGSGSTALQLARENTGRGGTGSAEAKAQQAEIVRALTAAGAR